MKSGKNVQVVVGMTVPQVRETFEHLVFDEKMISEFEYKSSSKKIRN